MAKFLLVLVVAIVAAAIVFGVVTLISDGSSGLQPAEPDSRARPLPGGRPLAESDLAAVRFDTAVRGYRMDQVDQALRRTAYDIGYKDELIGVLRAEVEALRDGRREEADELARAREAATAAAPGEPGTVEPGTAEPDDGAAVVSEAGVIEAGVIEVGVIELDEPAVAAVDDDLAAADEADSDRGTDAARDLDSDPDGDSDGGDGVPAGAFRAGADQK